MGANGTCQPFVTKKNKKVHEGVDNGTGRDYIINMDRANTATGSKTMENEITDYLYGFKRFNVAATREDHCFWNMVSALEQRFGFCESDAVDALETAIDDLYGD